MISVTKIWPGKTIMNVKYMASERGKEESDIQTGIKTDRNLLCVEKKRIATDYTKREGNPMAVSTCDISSR